MENDSVNPWLAGLKRPTVRMCEIPVFKLLSHKQLEPKNMRKTHRLCVARQVSVLVLVPVRGLPSIYGNGGQFGTSLLDGFHQ